MPLCSVCKKPLASKTSYINHFKLHRSVPNIMYPCYESDCPRTFSKYTTFKSHCSRDHKPSSCNESSQPSVNATFADPNVDLQVKQCTVPFCGKNFQQRKKLISHLNAHIDKGEIIKCPYANCAKPFKIKSSFSSHLSRSHKSLSGWEKTASNGEIPEMEEADSCNDSRGIYSDSNITNTDSSESANLLIQNVAQFLLKLESKHLVPSSTIQYIVGELMNINDIEEEAELQNFERFAHAHGLSPEVTQNMLEVFSNGRMFKHICKEHFSTDYKRKKHFKSNFKYVPPVTISLGDDENRIARSAQYIPIIDSLTAVLSNPCVLDHVKNVDTSHNIADILKDVEHGSISKNSSFFNENPTALKLILFQDAFEVVNPLSSRRLKHKVVGVYYTIGNFESYVRSSVDHIQLVMLVRESDLKYFGPQKVFQVLIEDLRKLEDGVEFPLPESKVSKNGIMKGTLLAIAGDNLGSHQLGGFLESFTNVMYFCRYCLITADEGQGFALGEKRSVEDYNDSLRHIENTSLDHFHGVKRDSVFNRLNFYHVCTPGLPPCLAHDIFEGVAAYDLKLCFDYLVKRKWLTYSELNVLVTKYPLVGGDAANKPCVVKETGKRLVGEASKIWCLIRMIPLFIGHKILDYDDNAWRMCMLLKSIVEIVCSPQVNHNLISHLHYMIEEYLDIRATVFPDELLKPKHHFLCHYPEMLMQFGPLIHYWTLRFEIKHFYLKKIARKSANFKNVCLSMATTHQLLQAFYSSGSLFAPKITVNSVTAFTPALYSPAVKQFSEENGLTESNTQCCSKVVFKGTEYAKDQYLIIGVDKEPIDTDVTFGKICIIFIVDNCKVFFALTVHSSRHLSHLHLYQIQSGSDIKLISYDELYDYYPLNEYKIQDMTVISLKHAVDVLS